MSVVDRSALEASPLADLHAIASELSIDGFRRLRRPELIDAILIKQGNDSPAGDDDAQGADDETPPRSRRGRRGGRGRGGARKDDESDAASTDADAETTE